MTWLVVGLGNPGLGYAKTRHNVGFMTADALASRLGVRWKRARGASAEVAEVPGARFGVDGQVVLVKPMTFMNNSGDAVAPLARYHKADPEHIVVVHDEIDLDFGGLRIKLGGGDNGHNGLKSLRARLGSGEFYRVRIGVSRPPGSRDPMDWVLGGFPSAQREDLKINIAEAADAVESLLRDGLIETQNRFNR
ncbi:MAG: aminoacyl-tRNA hydrolase [Propionibacteriaceae bacterium]|nr:aminoacyl-tRNA hydrolase [Propionibacteriaceae bacterium]